jgi:hypothetical protein
LISLPAASTGGQQSGLVGGQHQGFVCEVRTVPRLQQIFTPLRWPTNLFRGQQMSLPRLLAQKNAPAGQHRLRQHVRSPGQQVGPQLLSVFGVVFGQQRVPFGSPNPRAVSQYLGTQVDDFGQQALPHRSRPFGQGFAGTHWGIDPPPSVRTIFPAGSRSAPLQPLWSRVSQQTPLRPAKRSSISAVQGNFVPPKHWLTQR